MNIGNIILEKLDGISSVHKNAPARKSESDGEKIPEREPDRRDVHQAVAELNQAVHGLNERVSFTYNEKLNRVIVKVINSETDEVVREIPPKELIRLLEGLREYLGMFVDEIR